MFYEIPLKPRCGAKFPGNNPSRKAERLKIVLEIHWQHFSLGNLLARYGEFAGPQMHLVIHHFVVSGVYLSAKACKKLRAVISGPFNPT